MWGPEQEAWVLDQLGAARTTWNVVANQVVIGDLRLPNGAVVNYDQWDGYAPARRRVLAGVAERRVSNLVVLSGDIHLAAAVDLVLDDPARTVVGTELVTTSISSPGRIPGDVSALAAQVVPAVKYLDGARRGYARCTITPQTWTCEYRAVADVTRADSAVSTGATVVVTAGTPGAVRR
jgi:alkaline phosphatase D